MVTTPDEERSLKLAVSGQVVVEGSGVPVPGVAVSTAIRSVSWVWRSALVRRLLLRSLSSITLTPAAPAVLTERCAAGTIDCAQEGR
jgi:hypothetical protein